MRSLAQHFRTVLVVTALSLVSAAAHSETLSIMAGGTAKLVYLPLVLASSLGYFRDEGLDVKILSQHAGIDTTTELLSGATQGAVGFYDHTIDMQIHGVDLVSLVVFARSAGLVELSAQPGGPRTFAEIRGKRLGVTGLGSSTYFITRYLAAQAGVSPKDYTVVPMGSADQFIAAFREHRLDAALIEEPSATQVLAEHRATVLTDLRSVEGSRAALGGPYAGACLFVRREWLDSHPETAQKLATALVRALRYIVSHDAETIMAQVPDVPRADSAGYLDALRRAIPMFVADGRMPDGAPQTALRILRASDPSIDPHHVDLQHTYTNALVETAATTLH